MWLQPRNEGKLREFRNLLLPLESTILSLGDLSIDAGIRGIRTDLRGERAPESGRYSRLTLPVLADDSGTGGGALGGSPEYILPAMQGQGLRIRTAIRKLLEELPKPRGREARFVCALALAQEGSSALESEGECRGIIATNREGQMASATIRLFLPKSGKNLRGIKRIREESAQPSRPGRHLPSTRCKSLQSSIANRKSSIVTLAAWSELSYNNDP